MAHLQARTQAHDLEAFCATCPTPREVTELLQAVGFAVDFHMDTIPSACDSVPPLPAQYHYRDDRHGSEVIFLAGSDADLDGVPLPEHASRFWIYPGADAEAARWIAHVLAAKWSLTWHRLSQARQDVA
jgi:hypothetical protein